MLKGTGQTDRQMDARRQTDRRREHPLEMPEVPNEETKGKGVIDCKGIGGRIDCIRLESDDCVGRYQVVRRVLILSAKSTCLTNLNQTRDFMISNRIW